MSSPGLDDALGILIGYEKRVSRSLTPEVLPIIRDAGISQRHFSFVKSGAALPAGIFSTVNEGLITKSSAGTTPNFREYIDTQARASEIAASARA